MFLIRCSKCRNSMKYQPTKDIRLLDRLKKQCVYCGKILDIKNSIEKEL